MAFSYQLDSVGNREKFYLPLFHLHIVFIVKCQFFLSISLSCLTADFFFLLEREISLIVTSFSFISAPCAVRNLQDLARIYIRRTLRNFINEEMKAKGIAQKAPPKRKRRRCRRRRINTYVFVGNQLIPQPLDSEEDERMEDDNKEEEDKDHSEALKPEEPPRNLLREKIMSLPLPESLKAYLTYYREK